MRSNRLQFDSMATVLPKRCVELCFQKQGRVNDNGMCMEICKVNHSVQG